MAVEELYPASHPLIELCYLLNLESGGTQLQFAVGFKFHGKTGHVVVDAEDALIAALKVKMQRPEALIAYVRQQNKRGDTRHPMRRLGSESPSSDSAHLACCKQSACEIAFPGSVDPGGRSDELKTMRTSCRRHFFR